MLKDRKEILAFGLLIVVSSMAALLAVKNIKITPDSIHYALLSQQITSGNGLKTPLIRLDSHIIPIDGTIPQTWYPLLLPIVLALLGGVTPQSFLAAQILNLICHVVISVFTYLLIKHLYDNIGVALLTGVLVSISFPLLRITHHMWSETFFIALTLAAIYFLTVSRHSNHYQSGLYLVLASICASASILTRWPGLVFIPLFFWEAIVLIKNKKPRPKLRTIVIFLLIPIVTTLLVITRNYILWGEDILGVPFIATDMSYLNNFIGTIKNIFLQFQMGKNSITLVIAFSVLSIIYILINDNSGRELAKYFRTGLDLILIFMIGYTAFIFLSMVPRLELRYVSPLVPFLFIVSIFTIVFICKMIKLQGFSKLSFAGMLLCLSIIAFGNGYKTFLNLPEFFYKQQRIYSILNSCIYNWIKENYQENTTITTNRAHPLSFFGGYSTVILPHRRWQENTPIPEDMESVLPKRMSILGSKVLSLFGEAEEQYDGRYLAELFNKREDNDNFILVHECEDGVVYHLREETDR
jgi:hypothetical protein